MADNLMADKRQEKVLDTLVVLSYGTEPPKEQALVSQSHPRCGPAHFLNLDIIFIILSFLPTEVVLQLKTVCRAWAQLISDPLFIRAHCSRPAPITAFFTKKIRKRFRVQTSPKFPSMITSFRSSGFNTESTSHGLVCFYRDKDGVIVVANPATSHYALIPRHDKPPIYYIAYSHTLIYDPVVSPHFKLSRAVTYCPLVHSTYVAHRLSFHIYSTETSSWAVSSFNPPAHTYGALHTYDLGLLSNCRESKIGGGTVCWEEGGNNLRGYEIASNTHWETLLPTITEESDENRYAGWRYLMARDGDIHYACFHGERKKVKVVSLDENKSWVLEGECSTEELQELQSCDLKYRLVSYDRVRRVLIIELDTGDLLALHLSSSRIEFVGECTRDVYYWNKLPHSNTLAPLHGGKQDVDALNRLLHDVESGDETDDDEDTDD